MAKVYLATPEVKSLSRKAALPAKFERLLDKLDLKTRFSNKTVAVKMHLGGGTVYTTIHPLFVRTLIDKVREAGGKPFITDGPFSADNVARRGYTRESLGADIIPAAGPDEKHTYTVPVSYRNLTEVHLCGNVADADAMVVLSHFKAHGEAAYGGAIKNLAMGCVTRASRADLHRLETGGFTWDKQKCIRCGRCVDNCPTGACQKDEQGEIDVNLHNCVYCRHCAKSCPTHAIDINANSSKWLQDGLAIAAREVTRRFDPGSIIYLNLALDITPLCDCWGFTTPSIVPDIGIFGSLSMPAIDKACLDHVKPKNFIPGSLPAGRRLMSSSGHLFKRIWGSDPLHQIKAAEKFGLGTADYEIDYVE